MILGEGTLLLSRDPQSPSLTCIRPYRSETRLMDTTATFAFPLTNLADECVALEIFNGGLPAHIALVDAFIGVDDAEDLHRYLPWPAWKLREHFFAWYAARVQSSPSCAIFGIFDSLTRAPAGLIGLLNASVENQAAELGFLLVLPRWRRTHVTTHAVGLLVTHCMRDMRLRRLQWQANAENTASVRTAQRMGFTLEGVHRWQRVLASEKDGLRRGDDERPGRHTAMLAMCWDDWEEGTAHEKLKLQMERCNLMNERSALP